MEGVKHHEYRKTSWKKSALGTNRIAGSSAVGMDDHTQPETGKENPQKYKERDACFDNWEKVVKEHCPELAEKNRDFLDFLIGYYGNELESYYLLGLRDGIRVYQWVLNL